MSPGKPESGEIVLTDLTDAGLPASYSAYPPYHVGVDGKRLGSFGFKEETATERFDLSCPLARATWRPT